MATLSSDRASGLRSVQIYHIYMWVSCYYPQRLPKSCGMASKTY
jgi:hypothetical protein